MPIAIQLFQEPAEDNPVNVISCIALLCSSIDNLCCDRKSIQLKQFLAHRASERRYEAFRKWGAHTFRGIFSRRIGHR